MALKRDMETDGGRHRAVTWSTVSIGIPDRQKAQQSSPTDDKASNNEKPVFVPDTDFTADNRSIDSSSSRSCYLLTLPIQSLDALAIDESGLARP